MRKVVVCTLLILVAAFGAALAGVPKGWAPLRFTLLSLTGGMYTQEDIKDGTVAMAFWDSSHRLSKRLLEDLKTYQDRVGEDELRVFAVHSDGKSLNSSRLGEILAVARGSNLPFPILLDWNGRVRRAYRITEMPSVVVFNDYGRSAFNLKGYSLEQRGELAGSLHEVLGRDRETGKIAVVRSERDLARQRGASQNDGSSACRIPRSFYCLISAEKAAAISDPAVMAVRLSTCRGDIEGAKKMLRGVSKKKYLRSDLRFALGNMMLLNGNVEGASAVFSRLRDGAPNEGWGSWGLGLSALASGKEKEALRHMREAVAIDGGNAETETAVLKFMEEYWRKNRRAPGEKDFLALFTELSSVRDCYRELAGKG